jgi:hypothetical protein
MSSPIEFSASITGLDAAAQQWASYADALGQVIAQESQVAASEAKLGQAMGQTGQNAATAAQGVAQYGAALTQVQSQADGAANSMTKFGSVFAGAGTSAQGASSGVTEFTGALTGLSGELATTNADIGEYNTLSGKVVQSNSQIASSASGVASSQQQMGQSFQQNITSLGLAASGIVHLVGQYTQLERAQLLVSRSSLQLEKAQNTLVAMQLKYQAAVDAGKLSADQQALAQAKLAAQADTVAIAQERLTINTARLSETQANFAANIIPSIIQAATGIIGAFESMSVAFKAAGTSGFFAAAGIRAAMIATGIGAAIAIGTIAIQAFVSASDKAAESAAAAGPELEKMGTGAEAMAATFDEGTKTMAQGFETATNTVTTDIQKMGQVLPAELQSIAAEAKNFSTTLVENMTPTPEAVATITKPIKEDPTLKAIMGGAEANKAALTLGGGGKGGEFGKEVTAPVTTLGGLLFGNKPGPLTEITKLQDLSQDIEATGSNYLQFADQVIVGNENIVKSTNEAAVAQFDFKTAIDGAAAGQQEAIKIGQGLAQSMFGITGVSDKLAISIAQSAVKVTEFVAQGQTLDAVFEMQNLAKLITQFQMYGANAQHIIDVSSKLGASGVSLAENISGVADSYTRVNPLITQMVNAQVEEQQVTEASVASWEKYLNSIGVQVPAAVKLNSEMALEAAVAYKTTGTAAGVWADALNNQLAPAIATLGNALTAKNWDEFKDAFKELEFGDIGDKFEGWGKKVMRTISQMNENASEANTIFATMQVAFDIDKLPINKFVTGMQQISKEMERIGEASGKDTSKITQFLDDIAATKDPTNLVKYADIIDQIIESSKGGFNQQEIDKLNNSIAALNADPLTAVNDAFTAFNDITDTTSANVDSLNTKFGSFLISDLQRTGGDTTKLTPQEVTPPEDKKPGPTIPPQVIPAPVKAPDFDTVIAQVNTQLTSIGKGGGAVGAAGGGGGAAGGMAPVVIPAPNTDAFITGLTPFNTAILGIQNAGIIISTTPITIPAPIVDLFIAGLDLIAQSLLQYATTTAVFEQTPMIIPAPNTDAFVETMDLLIQVPQLFIDAWNNIFGGGGGGGKGKKKKGGGGGLVIPAPDTQPFLDGLEPFNTAILGIQNATNIINTTPIVIPAPDSSEFVDAMNTLLLVPQDFIDRFNSAMGSGGGGGGGKKKKKRKGGGGGGGLVIPAPNAEEFVNGMNEALNIATSFGQEFESIMGTVTEGLATAAESAATFAEDFDSAMSDAISAGASAATDLESSFGEIGSAASSAASEVDALGSAIEGLPSSKNITIHVGISGPGVKYLAEGYHGIIDKPTLLIVGEAGPERIDVGPAGGKASGLFMDRNLNVNPIMSTSEKAGIMDARRGPVSADPLFQMLRKQKLERDDVKELIEAFMDRVKGRVDAARRDAHGRAGEIKKFVIPVQLNWGKDVVMREIREGFLQD